MKKTLLLSLLGAIAFAFAPRAEAITVDDLDGKICAQIFAGNHSENGLPRHESCGVFRKINNTTVAVDNFFDDFTVTFTLSNNKLSLNVGSLSNPTQYSMTNGGRDYLVFYNVVGYSSTLTNRFTGVQTNYYRYQPTSQQSKFTSNAYADLGARGNGFTFDSSSNSSCYFAFAVNDDDYQSFVFYNFSLVVIEPNGYATEGDGTTYKLNYAVEDNSINFQNLFNIGVPYQNSYSPAGMKFNSTLSATIDENGNFTIPAQIVGGAREGRYQGYSPTVVDLGDRGTGNVSGAGWGYTNYPLTDYNFFMCSKTNGTGNITGKVYTKPVNHVSTTSMWANENNSKGAELKTYKGDVVTIDNIYLYDDYDGSVLRSASSILMTRTLDAEITHSVSINKTEYGYGKINDKDAGQYIYLNCNLTGFKNSDLVKDYELYIVPQVANPNYASSDFSHEDGHVNGTRIDLVEYATNFVPSDNDRKMRTLAESGETEETNPFEGYNYNLLIPEADLNAKDSNGKYQLYVKTIYTDESGLEPTFHALTALGDTTTGVEDIIDNGELNDEDAPVMFYNMNGVQMDGNNLTPGLYIRRQGTSTSKVIIR